jgi:cell division protein FtsI/penicillin-binding protein 2
MNVTQNHTRSEPGDRALRFRAALLCSGVVTVFSLLSWRLINLQYLQHGHFQAVIEKTHVKTQTLNAFRGDILDTRGRVLACDERVQQVSFELDFLKQGSRLAKALAKLEGMKPADLRHAHELEELQNRYLKHLGRIAAPIMKMTPEEFEAKVRARLSVRDTGEAALTRDLSISAAIKLRQELESAGLGKYAENQRRSTLGALVFQTAFARRYPADLPLTHIVGFFGESKPGPGTEAAPPRGVAGVERFFNDQLTGIPGKREFEVDGWANEMPAFRGHITQPRNGMGLRLSLDLGLQGLLDKTLDETARTNPDHGRDGLSEVYLNQLEAQRVIVVLFDPATMGVRAIGCRDRIHGPNKPLLNNPASEMLYEPGSIIKIVTMAGAISSGKVNAASRIEISASGQYAEEGVSVIKDEHRMASGSVEEILVHSSNIGAFKLGKMLGTKRFEELFRDFGFCARTGFESPQESRGYFGDKMNLQTLSRVSFGNAIVVTPAQLCGALGAIINDGIYQPMHLAESWVDETGKPVEGLSPLPSRRVVSSAAAQAVRRAMLKVVEDGTGKYARSERFKIAAKTGTAEKAVSITMKDGSRRSEYRGDYICSMIGFVPADKPRLGMLVIVDDPGTTTIPHYGGPMAGPLFRRIAERAMAYYQIPDQFSPAVKMLPQAASNIPVRANLPTFTR